jgi:hypothetical protein
MNHDAAMPAPTVGASTLSQLDYIKRSALGGAAREREVPHKPPDQAGQASSDDGPGTGSKMANE